MPNIPKKVGEGVKESSSNTTEFNENSTVKDSTDELLLNSITYQDLFNNKIFYAVGNGKIIAKHSSPRAIFESLREMNILPVDYGEIFFEDPLMNKVMGVESGGLYDKITLITQLFYEGHKNIGLHFSYGTVDVILLKDSDALNDGDSIESHIEQIMEHPPKIYN